MNKLLTSLLMIGVIAGMAGAGTWAYFTDTATSTGNTFTAGTVKLVKGTEVFQIGYDNMKPGDSKTVTIPITNGGSLPFTYVVGVSTNTENTNSLFAPQGTPPGNTPATATITSGPGPLPLNVGATANVVVTVNLPTSAGNQYQADSGIVTVTITATQIIP